MRPNLLRFGWLLRVETSIRPINSAGTGCKSVFVEAGARLDLRSHTGKTPLAVADTLVASNFLAAVDETKGEYVSVNITATTDTLIILLAVPISICAAQAQTLVVNGNAGRRAGHSAPPGSNQTTVIHLLSAIPR